MKINSFQDLTVYQRSINYVKMIYDITRNFPRSEQFVLVDQLKRSAISIPSNIAEGYGRYSRKEYSRFLKIALSSTYENYCQINIGYELKYIENRKFNEILSINKEIQAMLTTLIKKIC